MKDRDAHLFSEAGAALAERLDALIDSAKAPPGTLAAGTWN